MKKFMLAAAVSAVAALGMSSTASATITTPLGSAISGSGTVSFRGTVISTSCTVTVSGTVASTTRVNITSVAFTGCGAGATLAVLGLPGTPWVATITLSPRNFSITGVQVALTAPIVGTCLYTGGLTGTYTVGANSALTIGADSLSRVSGGSFCTSNPTVTGTINTNVATR